MPAGSGGFVVEPELDRLSNILAAFNDQFGNIEWKDADKIRQVIAEELPERVSADEKYRNAMANSDRENARIEHDRALGLGIALGGGRLRRAARSAAAPPGSRRRASDAPDRDIGRCRRAQMGS